MSDIMISLVHELLRKELAINAVSYRLIQMTLIVTFIQRNKIPSRGF